MKKTAYRILGIFIFVTNLLVYSLNMQLIVISKNILITADYITDSIYISLPTASKIIFVVLLIISVLVGIIIPYKIKE